VYCVIESLRWQVTTLLSAADKLSKQAPPTPEELAALQAQVSAQGSAVKELKTAKAEKPVLQVSGHFLNK
jgi:hypothetical protein